MVQAQELQEFIGRYPRPFLKLVLKMKQVPVGLLGQLIQIGLGLKMGLGVGESGFDALVVGYGCRG